MRGIYVERSLISPPPEEGELVELDAQMVPILLSAIGGRLGPSHYQTREDWLATWPRLALAGERLLMSGVDRIVSEIRALRMGELTPENWRDPAISPYNFDATSLVKIQFNLQDNEGSAAQILARIEDILQRTEEGDGNSLEALLQIVALLSA